MMGTVIAEFVAYTEYHFEAEERLLRRHEYPEYDEHKEMHDDLASKAHSLKQAFDEGNTPTAIEVMLLLTNWLNMHILEEDRKYKPYTEGKTKD
jgi:hemerythrin